VIDVRVEPGYDPNTTRLTTSEGLEAATGEDRGGRDIAHARRRDD
jgi:hypothetical protein